MTTTESNCQLYFDDAHEGVQILTFIGGEYSYVNQVRAFIQNEIDSFKKKHGQDFKGFHANKVGADNWNAYAGHFEDIINFLIKLSSEGHIRCGAIVCNELTWKNKISELKDMIKNQMDDKNSSISKTLGSISDSQAPMLYQRFGQIYPAIVIKNSALREFSTIECYPDSVGKWLSHGTEKFAANSTFGVTVEMDMFKSAEVLANAFDNIIKKALSKSGPRFIKMEPKADEDEPILQACDIISNLLLNKLRVIAGAVDKSRQMKSGLITRLMPNLSVLIPDDAGFSLNGDKLICQNPTFCKVIDLGEVT